MSNGTAVGRICQMIFLPAVGSPVGLTAGAAVPCASNAVCDTIDEFTRKMLTTLKLNKGFNMSYSVKAIPTAN